MEYIFKSKSFGWLYIKKCLLKRHILDSRGKHTSVQTYSVAAWLYTRQEM